MAKPKMKQALIPKFSNEAEEAEWWDTHRIEIEHEIRQRLKQKQPLTLDHLLHGTKSSQPITLRVPKEDLDTARRLAAQKGLGYQTYIKMLLRDALKTEQNKYAARSDGKKTAKSDARKFARQGAGNGR
jgi:predicted DNA binding CopG/RHH family protein